MEYLGAVIDIDIKGFLNSVKEMLYNIDLLDKEGTKKTKEFTTAFKNAISNMKTESLEDTIADLQKAKAMFNDVKGKLREDYKDLNDVQFKSMIDTMSKSVDGVIKKLEDEVARAVEIKRVAINKLRKDDYEIPHRSTHQDAIAIAQSGLDNTQVQEATESIKEVKEANDELTDSTKKATEANEGLGDAMREVTDSCEEQEEEVKKSGKVSIDFLKKYGDGIDYISDASDKLSKKTRDVLSRMGNLSGAAMESAKSDSQDVQDAGLVVTELITELKTGKISLRDFKRELNDIYSATKRISAQGDISTENRKKIRALNYELNETSQRLKKIVYDNGRTEKSMSTTANLLTRMASKLLPQRFRYILMTLRNTFGYLSIGIAGVGAALIGVITYIKQFYQWNKRLIGLKWGDFKDQLKVMGGYMAKEDAITASVKRRTEVIREETQALLENMEAQRKASTAMERTETTYDRNIVRREAKNNIVNDESFNWFGFRRAPTDEEFYANIRDKKGAYRFNKEKIMKFLEASDDEVARWTDEEFKQVRIEYEQALARHEALKDVDEQLSKLEVARKYYIKLIKEKKEKEIKFLYDDDASEEEIESITKAYDEELLEAINEFNEEKKRILSKYNELLNEQKKFNDNLEYWKSRTDKVRLNERATNAQQKIDVLEMDELGLGQWTDAQQEKDVVGEMMRKRNDYREYELWLIKRKSELQKKNIDISGEENAQTKKLGIEVKSLSEQLEKLKGMGLTSEVHQRLIEDTENELKLKRIEEENSAYQDQVKELERILSLRKEENELKGFEGYNVENANLEIQTMEKRIEGLMNQKFISAEERKEVDKLLIDLEKLIDSRDKLARQNFEISINHKFDLQKEDLDFEAKNVKLGVGMEGQNNVFYQERQLEISEKSVKLELDKAEILLKEMKGQKKLAEENEKAGENGVKWTHEQNMAYQKQIALVNKLKAELNSADDARQRGVEGAQINEIGRLTDLETRRLEVEARRNKLYSERKGRSQYEIDIKDLQYSIDIAENEYEAEKKVVAMLEERQKLAQAGAKDEKGNDIVWNDAVDNETLAEHNQKLEEAKIKWDEAKDAMLLYMKELQDKIGIFDAIAEGLHDIASIVEDDLGENAFSNIVEGLGNVADATTKIVEMKERGVSGSDKASAWVQAAKFVSGQVSGIIATQRRIKESAEEWKQAVADVAHEYTMIQLDKLEYKQQNIFGVEDPYKKLQDNSNKYMEARKATYDMLAKIEGQGVMKVGETTKEKWDAIMADTLTGLGTGVLAGGVAGGGVFSGVGAVIGGAIGAATGFLTGLFKDKEVVDVFDTLQNKFGEVFDPETLEINDQILASYDLLDDKTKKLIDDYKELKEKQDEAMEDFKAYAKELFGDVGLELSKQLQSAFRNGDLYSSVKDFTAFVKTQIENIVSQKIFNTVFGQLFDGISKRVEDSIEHGGANIEDILANIPYQTEELIGKYGVLMQKVQDSMEGWDLFSPEEATQDALKGKISSMSEDTASKLNGNFMGLKLSAMEINTKMTSVKNFMEDNNSILNRSLNTLQRIADNTHFCRRLESIEDGLNDIRMNGLRVV